MRTYRKHFLLLLLLALCIGLASFPASADSTVTVTPSDTVAAPFNSEVCPATDKWCQANIRTASDAQITTTQPRSGKGSLEFTGGNGSSKADYVYYFTPPANLADYPKLSELDALSFEWYRDSSSTNPAVQVPVIRLYYANLNNDGTAIIASGLLIWEWTYTNAGNAPTDSWQLADALPGNFWMRAFGPGRTIDDYNITLAEWMANADEEGTIDDDQDSDVPHVLSGDTRIVAFNVGFGSGWNGVTKAFVDNVKIGFNGNTTTYNFEPDPTCDGEMVCYVDDDGSDANSGLTPATAKKTIQAGIDAVAAGGEVRVLPGTYSETATGRTLTTGGTYQFGLFFADSKPGVKVIGVTAGDVEIINPASVLATINTNANNNFGPSGIFVEGDDVQIRGVKIGTNSFGLNKTIEVIGDNFKLLNSHVADPEGSVYINDFRFNIGTNTSRVQSYEIDNNIFDAGVSIDIASGAGFSGAVNSRKITDNVFDDNGGFWPVISFNGSDTGVPWFVYSVGGAVITGNTFGTGEQYIRARGTYDNTQFDWESYWNDNTYEKAAVTVTSFPPFGDVRTYSYTSGSYNFNHVRRIGGIIQQQEDIAQDGDTVLVKAGTYPENVAIDKNIALVGANYDVCASNPADLSLLNPARLAESFVNPASGDAFTIAPTADNVTINGFAVTTAINSGVYAWNAADPGFENIHILNNRFEGLQGWGIFSGGADRVDWKINCNRFDGWSGTDKTAVWLAGETNDGLEMKQNFVRGTTGVAGARGFIVDGGIDAVIENNAFTNLTRYAIQLNNSADKVLVQNNTISNVEVGVQLLTSGGGPTGILDDVTVKNNTITDVKAIAIYLSRATTGNPPASNVNNLLIENNTITQDVSKLTNNFGLIDLRFDPAVNTHGLVTVKNNTVTFTGAFTGAATAAHGIRVRGNAVEVDILNNTVDANDIVGTATNPPTSGVFIQTSDATFGNLPATAAITVTKNTITDFANGVSVFDVVNNIFGGLPAGNQVHVNRNSITSNVTSGAVNAGNALLDAECNWWGAANGPSSVGPGDGDAVSSAVDFTPWLTSSNLDGDCTAPVVTLNLTAECRVGDLLYWRVTGDDATNDVNFTWAEYGGDENGGGQVDGGAKYYFTTTVPAKTVNLTWFNPAEGKDVTIPKAHNNAPCVGHVTFAKQWNGADAPDLDGAVLLTAESSIATASCTSDDGALTCTYTRKSNNSVIADLEVPFGESYSVSENGVTEWKTVSGVGSGFEVIDGFVLADLPNALNYDVADDRYCVTDANAAFPQNLAKYCTHTVVNEFTPVVKLNLTAECRVGDLLYWRVTGDDATNDVNFTWAEYGGDENGGGQVDGGAKYYFTTTVPAKTVNLTWFNPAEGKDVTIPKAHNNAPCVGHVTFAKQWNGADAPDLDGAVLLTAESSIATASCTSDDGALTCTYTRTSNNSVIADLEVPFGESYSVSETVPGGWQVVSGVGSGFEVIDGFVLADLPNALNYDVADDRYCVTDENAAFPQNLAKYCTHTVVNERLAKITVLKYNDLNGDGDKDGDAEAGLQGWLFTLYRHDNNAWVEVDTANTGPNGFANFFDLAPGKYKVCETNQAGWANTQPGGGSLCVEVTRAAGEGYKGVDVIRFGNVKLSSIKIVKDSFPNNGTNFEFSLTGQPNFMLDDATPNDKDGISSSKEFKNLLPGEYSVAEILPAGWDLTRVECKAQTLDGDKTDVYADTTDNGATIDLKSGQKVTCTFTNVQEERDPAPVCISLASLQAGQVINDTWLGTDLYPGGVLKVNTSGQTMVGKTDVNPKFYEDNRPGNAFNWSPEGMIISNREFVHDYMFMFNPNLKVTGFSLRVFDRGDYNPADANEWLSQLAAYNGMAVVDSDSFNWMGGISILGDVFTAIAGEPGNRGYAVSGADITSAKLLFGYEAPFPRNFNSSIIGPVVGGTSADPHIGIGELCVDFEERKGSITVVKDAQPNHAQDFTFEFRPGTGTFKLDDDNNNSLPNNKVFGDLSAGNYTIRERNIPQTWQLVGATCELKTGGAANYSFDPQMGKVTVNLGIGQDVVCTFTNEKLEIPPACPATQYNQVIEWQQGTRKNGTPVLAERSNPDLAEGFAQNNDMLNFFTLGFGGYAVIEFNPAQGVVFNGPGNDVRIVETSFGDFDDPWTNYPESVKVEASQDGVTWVVIGNTSDKDQSYDLGALPWARYFRLTDTSDKSKFGATDDGFDIDAVEGIHCGPLRKITIQKNSGEPGFDANVTFAGDLPDVNGDAEGDFAINGNNGMYTFENLAPGEYNVTEWVPTDWTLTKVTCNQEEQPIVNNGVLIDVNEGDAICTFHNNYTPPPGKIIVTKDIIGDGTGTFTICVGDVCQDFNGEETKEFEVAPGTYTVSEQEAGDDWNEPASQQVTVKPGETKEVTITNTYVPPMGKIVVIKDVVGGTDAQDFAFNAYDLGAQSLLAAFNLDDDGNNTLSNMWMKEVAPGSYAVTETPLDDWGVTIQCVSDVAGIVGQAMEDPNTYGDGLGFAVADDETVTCTFSNTYTPRPAYIEVTKDIEGNATGMFTICVGDVCQDFNGEETKSFKVEAGTYTVSEKDAGPDWTEPASQQVTVKPGETAKVTVTNRYTPRPGYIEVTKDIIGDKTGTFTICVNNDCRQFNGEGTQTWEVAAGTYTVSEQDAGDNWLEPASQQVTVKPGETKQVTVTNTYVVSKSYIRVTKAIEGNGTGTFTICVNNDCRQFNGEGTQTFEVAAGTYTVSEQDAGANWTEPAAQQVTVGEGETKDVTVTNIYVPPVLCPALDPYAHLSAVIEPTGNPNEWRARIMNTSDCKYDVGFATYEKPSNVQHEQILYSSDTRLQIMKGETIITLTAPQCAAQLDVFFDASHLGVYNTYAGQQGNLDLAPLVLPAFATNLYGPFGNWYGPRLLSYIHVAGAYCVAEPIEEPVIEEPVVEEPVIEEPVQPVEIQEPVVLDDDQDGVANDIDLCAGTADATVDANGCGASQLDDDADGVNNATDACLATAAGIAVDAAGCEIPAAPAEAPVAPAEVPAEEPVAPAEEPAEVPAETTPETGSEG